MEPDANQYQDKVKEAAAKLTPEQAVRALNLLSFLDDGCNFLMSWKNDGPGRCRDRTGKDFDCANCMARDLLKELGLK